MLKSEIKKVNVFQNNNSSNIQHMYDDSHTMWFYDFFFTWNTSLADLKISQSMQFRFFLRYVYEALDFDFGNFLKMVKIGK